MTYNGQLWEKDLVGSTTKMTFNYGKGWPAAGWRLGFGRIIEDYDHGVSGKNNLLIQSDGTKIALIYDSASTKCLSQDGTFLEYAPDTGKLKYPDGTIVQYENTGSTNNRRLPTSIKSRNGNIVTIAYKIGSPYSKFAIDAITDTLGRVITFHYYGDGVGPDGYKPPGASGPNLLGSLYSVRTEDRGFIPGDPTNLPKRELIVIRYRDLPFTMSASLFDASYTVDLPSQPVTVVDRIYYPSTGTGYLFDYASPYGMITTVHVRKDMTAALDGNDVSYSTYGFPTTPQALNNVPRFSSRTEWRDDGAGGSSTATYNYASGTSGSDKTYTVTAMSASPDVIVTKTTTDGTTGRVSK